MTKAVAVLRVSTEDQGRSGLGLEAQAASIQAWCERSGVELVAMYREVGVSGATPLEKREVLLSALELVRSAGARHLVVAKLDRLSRDSLTSLLIERELSRFSASVVSCDGAGNGDAPAEVFMRQIMTATAELERKQIAARTKAALAAHKARGGDVGRAPYGYRYEQKKLVPDATEQAVVQTVLDLRARGESIRRIAERLAALGVVTRKGTPWAPTQVHRVIQAEEA